MAIVQIDASNVKTGGLQYYSVYNKTSSVFIASDNIRMTRDLGM